MNEHELPFGIVQVALTPDQAEVIAPLVRRQPIDRRGLLLATAAPDIQDAQPTTFRMQIVFLDHRRAQRVLKIIREGTQ